jgi:hypothetical protein
MTVSRDVITLVRLLALLLCAGWSGVDALGPGAERQEPEATAGRVPAFPFAVASGPSWPRLPAPHPGTPQPPAPHPEREVAPVRPPGSLPAAEPGSAAPPIPSFFERVSYRTTGPPLQIG